MKSSLGRGITIAAVTIKVLLVAAGFVVSTAHPALEYLDRTINLFLLVVAGVWVVRFTSRARDGMLWKVSRKLLLSYILIGAVPILLLVTFSMLAFLLVFFDVSAYLVQNRFGDLTERASTFARTTLYEIERARVQDRLPIADHRQAAIRTRHPGSVVSVVSTSGNPPCDVPPSSEPAPPAQGVLPRWVGCRGFAGMIDGGSMIARAAALPSSLNPEYAVIVDLPVDESLAGRLDDAGIQLGQERRSRFNTATFLTITDWNTGLTHPRAVSISVNVGRLYQWLGSSQDAATSFNRELVAVLLGIGALLLVIEIMALGNGLALARSITASVDDLFQGTARVKGGDFNNAIAVRSTDQLGELAASFNDMTGRIQLLLVEQSEKRRLEEELRIARNIQMSLLPQGSLSVPGLSVSALCAPAREVGGDYYDWLPLDDGRIGLLIADVAGKGTSAALYMAELKGLMLSLSRIHTSPRNLLIEANQIISQHLHSGSFITAIYAMIDLEAGLLTCARAGHTPFIRIPAGHEDDRRASVLAPDGMVLGLNLDRGERFERALEEVTIPLQSGDLFFFFTDGVSEAMDGGGDCYGETRLVAFLEANAAQPTEVIRDRLLGAITGFADGQPQHDDITMIILRVE
jgi:serine phosphatase RsbU (regulator of sigma subunit)